MKAKYLFLIITVLFLGCKTKPFQFPKMVYQNSHNHDEHVFRMNGDNTDVTDSLVLDQILFMRSNEKMAVPNVKRGETYEFDTLFSHEGLRFKYFYKQMNKYYKKSVSHLRVIAFSVDSTLQNYRICLDTTIVNSKDSTYWFHSNN